MTDDQTRPSHDLDAALDDARVPASTQQGNAGHDVATEYARGARLLRLRAARMTYSQIAEQEGYADAAGARNALIRALTRHEAENVTELRTLENLALDADERVLRTITGDRETPPLAKVAAINARTRLSARRARLNGLDAPIQVALSAGVAADLDDALAEAEAVLIRGELVHDVSSMDQPERLEG